MIINRSWAMPNKNTFSIKPINELVNRYAKGAVSSCDPFANKNRIAKFCNDLDPQYETDYCMDAIDFLKQFNDNSMDLVLFDPPYSHRQVSECYKSLDMTVNMQTTQSSFWGNLKKEIHRVTSTGGTVITFGWNSGGIGKTKGFEIKEILIVAHGGWHNDTICTVEVLNEK
ncbi:MAG TPA: hypothetical protein VIC51_06120 [Psychromonas sp.]